MQRKFDQAFDTFNKFSLTKFSKKKIEKIFAGALFRKTFETVSKKTLRIFTRKI